MRACLSFLNVDLLDRSGVIGRLFAMNARTTCYVNGTLSENDVYFHESSLTALPEACSSTAFLEIVVKDLSLRL